MSAVIIAPALDRGSWADILVKYIRTGFSARNVQVCILPVCDLDLNLVAGLLLGRPRSSETPPHNKICSAIEIASAASIAVVVTPVHNGSCSGVVKMFLDALPEGALTDTTALPVGVAGSLRHCSALAYTLVPILHALGATDVVTPFCVAPNDWVGTVDRGMRLSEAAEARLNRRVSEAARSQPTRLAQGHVAS